jgi:hypothetical protein
VLHGPGFELDLENYRFFPTSSKVLAEPSFEPAQEKLAAASLPEARPTVRRVVPDVAAAPVVPSSGAGAIAGLSQPAPRQAYSAPDLAPEDEQPPARREQARRGWPFTGGGARRVAGQPQVQKLQE